MFSGTPLCLWLAAAFFFFFSQALPYAFGKLGMRAKVYATLPVWKMGQMAVYDAYISRTHEVSANCKGTLSQYKQVLAYTRICQSMCPTRHTLERLLHLEEIRHVAGGRGRGAGGRE